MAEAIKTKVVLNKPDGTKEAVDRVVLALTDKEAESLRIVCGAIGGNPTGSRRGLFSDTDNSIDTALHNAGIQLPDGEDYDGNDYHYGSIEFKSGK